MVRQCAGRKVRTTMFRGMINVVYWGEGLERSGKRKFYWGENFQKPDNLLTT